MAGTQVRRILVKVDTGGDNSLNSIKNSFKSLNGTVKESAGILQSFKNTFQALVGASILGFGITSITNLIDTYQKLGDRIKVFEGSQEKANDTMENIAKVADRTKSSIEGIATVYTRLALSLKETGITSGSLLFLTEQLQNSFRLSGSTAAEATASVIQLSQGLASGQLRGQELRSVLEQNAVFGGLLAEKLNIARGALLKYAEAAGGIKSKTVIEAILLGSEKLNTESKLLGVTFAEATQKGLNQFTKALGEMNKQFGISASYDKVISTLVDNMNLIGAAAISLAVLSLPKLIAQIELLGVALLANPVSAIFFGLGAGLAYAILETDRFVGKMLELRFSIKEWAAGAIADILEFGLTVHKVLTFGNREDDPITTLYKKGIEASNKMKEQATKDLEDTRDAAEQYEKARTAIGNLGVTSFKQQQEQLRKELEKTLKFGAKVDTTSPKKALEALNIAFSEGLIPVEKYNKKLLELTEKINSKKGPNVLADAIQKIKEENLGRELGAGIIKIKEYDIALNSLKLEELTRKFNLGRISAAEFHKEINATSMAFRSDSAIYTGINNYIESSGTLAQNVAKNITLVFNTLEDTLVDFVKTGTFEFKKFATAVLDDLTRIILRAAIIQPLARGILGSFSGASSGDQGLGTNANGSFTTEGGFAKGGAFNNGTQFFARGGVVDRATSFGMSSGRQGVMGEAGPEAILPLSRGPGGKLGVSGSGVTVNIINNSNSEVTQTEQTGPSGEKILEVLIQSKTREMFSTGKMDRTMKQLYGINRKGS